MANNEVLSLGLCKFYRIGASANATNRDAIDVLPRVAADFHWRIGTAQTLHRGEQSAAVRRALTHDYQPQAY